MAIDYQQVIVESRQELRESVAQREALDKRINELRSALRALAKFIPEAERQQVMEEVNAAKRRGVSLTAAIVDLLAQPPYRAGLSSQQIRANLEESGFDLEEYSQPLAAVMTTLQRLVDQKRVMRTFAKLEAGRPVGVTFKMNASQLLKRADG